MLCGTVCRPAQPQPFTQHQHLCLLHIDARLLLSFRLCCSPESHPVTAVCTVPVCASGSAREGEQFKVSRQLLMPDASSSLLCPLSTSPVQKCPSRFQLPCQGLMLRSRLEGKIPTIRP